jgi:ATP-binding cassette, subfamily B (MDR/TAP), member 1
VFFSVLLVLPALGFLGTPILAVLQAVAASAQFFDVIDSPKVNYSGRMGLEISADQDIEFRDVNFSYPSRPDTQVLKGFSARFAKGQTTALVGPSGSGKSTIVALLQRWYELESGYDIDNKPEGSRSSSPHQDKIMLGGRDVREVGLKWWRSQIGLVQQEPFLFNDTIFNNVAAGLTGTIWEDSDIADKLQRVQDACREAYADVFIRALPDGYSTKVGESGIKLSGGQRQRLAIARSIVRDPAILILDEATSSIDVRSERIVQQALDQVARNRTTIVIAHRLSTIRKADKIVVLRHGRNVEEGTHEHLLSIPDGVYAGLVRAQRLALETTESTTSMVNDASEADLARTITSGTQAGEEVCTFYKQRGFFGSVGRLIYEQRRFWMLYAAILVAAMTASGE